MAMSANRATMLTLITPRRSLSRAMLTAVDRDTTAKAAEAHQERNIQGRLVSDTVRPYPRSAYRNAGPGIIVDRHFQGTHASGPLRCCALS